MPFEGSYSIEAPHGTVVFYTQGGRLVAIAFADDVCLIAKSPGFFYERHGLREGLGRRAAGGRPTS